MARKIASDIPDEEQRQYMLPQIDRSQMWKSMTAEELAAIQQDLIAWVATLSEFSFFSTSRVKLAEKIGKRHWGFSIRPDSSSIPTRSGKERLEGQIMLALQYSALKSERGFAIMESIIPKLNELVSAAAVLNEFENNYLRDGEWNMTGEGAVGALLTTLAHNAGYFARLDFERSVTLASQFERAELRLMAHQKIAQSVLANPPKSGADIRWFERIH